MRLTKLEMQGFKSFAKKTELQFGSGITAVIGPNGSGKSNISDAVRWVLGEQSARALRGAKMEDVIFNGTQKRRPLGMAEVTLSFDNSDHALPVDYAEVGVTRRVYRNGESEYAINGKTCRLKDVLELFRDTNPPTAAPRWRRRPVSCATVCAGPKRRKSWRTPRRTWSASATFSMSWKAV